MKKVILEDIENMKYLLGYKRGVVISEQDMDNDVDPKLVASAEQSSNVTPSTTTTNTQTTQPIQIGVKNPRVQVLQQLLNDKFQSGLVADGIYGPKTANAIYKNIIAINKQQIKPIEGVVQPVTTFATTAPVVKAQPITAAPVVAK
jgi:peptidoglycan hydrolase-like protein with peptidoglycan-binding domain